MASQPVGQVSGSLIDWAAGVIGISPAVVAAQINMESGGQPGAVSSANAQGVAQFLPSTWSGLGCGGSPFNVTDSMRCYAKYMYQLVQQFHGNVRDALAAYNAGPGNLQAGYGYADSILAAAGQPRNVRSSGGTGTSAELTAAKQGQQTADVGASKDPSCAWGIHGGIPIVSKIPIVGGKFTADLCFLRKTTIRHAIGGLIVGAGFLVMLPGVAITIAYGFRASGAARVAAQSAGALGPPGRAVNRVIMAPTERRYRRMQAEPKQRIPRSQVRPARGRPRQIEGTLPS